METSINMARIAVENGTKALACTPHIMPPTYPNTVAIISAGIRQLQAELEKHQIPLKLVSGADIHIASDLVEGLTSKRLPALNGTRYFLFEPPHRVLPPNLVPFSKKVLQAGFRPVLTHPERLSWVANHYDVFCELDKVGLPIQITGGSLTGQFGKTIQNITLRMLEENRVDIVASDAHNLTSRSPNLRPAYQMVANEFGAERAELLFLLNPLAILKNQELAPRKSQNVKPKKKVGFLGKILGSKN